MTVARFPIAALVGFAAALAAASALPGPAPAQPAPPPPLVLTPDGRLRVAVDAVTGGDLTGGAASSEGMATMLTDILANDGRFAVIDVAVGGARVSAAPIVVKGSITRFNAGAGGVGLTAGGLPGGVGGGARSRRTTVTVSLRFIDTNTGEVVATASAEGAADAQEADAGLAGEGRGTLGAAAFRASSTGQAIEDAMKSAVDKLARGPWASSRLAGG